MNYNNIKSYEDACKALNIDPKEDLPYAEPVTPKQLFINAAAKLDTIAKALNNGWVPDWDNSSEWKYWPYFDMRTKSGFGFSFSYSFRWITSSDVGARLVFKSRELSDYAGTQFKDVYKDLLTVQPQPAA